MHVRMRRAALVLFACAFLVESVAQAAVSPEDFDALKQEVQNLRAKKQVATPPSGAVGRADVLTGEKYGPDAVVRTKEGRLQIGGLVQIWDYKIQDDNQGAYAKLQRNFSNANSNEVFDNDGYRIRRAELKFTMKITDAIQAVVLVDPTGGDEGNSFPSIPSNQGIVGRTATGGTGSVDLNTINQVLNSFNFTTFTANFNAAAKNSIQNGLMTPNKTLQDAYLNYYDPNLIPHHDFTVGQFKPPMGEEGNRNSGQLDFAERAMVNQFSNQRDLGIMVHGTWFGDRLQYNLGVFDGATSFQNTFASFQNRSDDNDAKDFAWRIQGRPVWDAEKWYGRLEVGYSRQDGEHGEAGHGFRDTASLLFTPTVDGLSLQRTNAHRQYAFAWYRPGGPVRGWWLRGEWGEIFDRGLPGLLAVRRIQAAPHPYSRDGWYFATGYKLSESIWADSLKNNSFFLWKMLHDVEFAYRYETFGNLVVEDLTALFTPTGGSARPVRTDVFKTNVNTAGINYYWKGYNVRTQVNYMWVDEDQGHAVGNGAFPIPGQGVSRRIREVKNNVFLVSQQVMW